MTSTRVEPNDDELQGFWERARPKVEGGHLPLVTGPSSSEMLLPPAWAFGDDPAQAEELLGLVLSGRKTATASAAIEYEREDVPLPSVGELSIILDGSAQPRALVATTRVEVVNFYDVDEAHAAAEGEGDLSLESWRSAHRRFFIEKGVFSLEMPVVLESFTVVYQE